MILVEQITDKEHTVKNLETSSFVIRLCAINGMTAESAISDKFFKNMEKKYFLLGILHILIEYANSYRTLRIEG